MESAPALAAFDAASANLRIVLRGLWAALGAWGLEAALGLLLYRRVSETLRRIERMLARFRAGTLRRAATPSTQRAGRCGAIRRANCTLPRRFGWLVRACGWRAAGYGSQLQTVLSTPEMSELLAQSPQAVRILRPLCRALAVDLPIMADKPRTPREDRPRKIRVRKKPEPYKIPLPRGVISAARRAGYGRDR